MANPLISRIKVTAIKTEGTAGTAETLTASEAVMNCYDTQFAADIPTSDRPSEGTYDAPLQSIHGARGGTVSFRTDLIGNDSAAPYWMTHALVPCGFSLSSLTATANGSANSTTATVAKYLNGNKYFIAGAMGSLSIPFTVGEPLMGNFTFTGKYQNAVAATILAPTKVATNPPRVASATITLGGTALKFSSGTINIENNVVGRMDDSDLTGYLHHVITQQTVTISLDPEAALVGTRDDYGIMLAETTSTFSMQVGSAGNQLTFTIPGCQRITVEDGDREGIATSPLTLLHTGSTAMTIVSA